jgi:hypothetical protein
VSLRGFCGNLLHYVPLLHPHCVMTDCLSKAAISCSALNRSGCSVVFIWCSWWDEHSAEPSGSGSAEAFLPFVQSAA